MIFFSIAYNIRMPTKKIYTNTLAQIAGKVMTGLISIFLIKIVADYLDTSGYGMYSKIYNYLSIFAVLADLGLYTISVREMSQVHDNPEKLEKISGNILSLRTLSGLIIMVWRLELGFSWNDTILQRHFFPFLLFRFLHCLD